MAPDPARRRHAGRAPTGGKRYTIAEVEPGVIGIRECHCLTCGRRLLRNGGNPRQVIQDLGLGRKVYRVLRKRCPLCGEIKPDYSALWLRFGHYHENYRRRARQHFLQGLPPGRARKGGMSIKNELSPPSFRASAVKNETKGGKR